MPTAPHILGRLTYACFYSASLLMACGDGLVDAEYLGEPLYTLRGNVLLNDIDPDGELPAGELRVALVWTTGQPALSDPQLIDPIEQQTVATARFPAQYDLALYSPPSEAAWGEHPGITGGPVAFGALLIYIDTNGDELWTSDVAVPDPLVGGAYDRVLVYAPQPVSGTSVGGKLAAGYHVMRPASDMPCEAPVQAERMPLVPVDDRRVDLQLGADYDRLLLDLDCDAGTAEWCAWCPALDVVLVQLERLCGGIDPERIACTSAQTQRSDWPLDVCDELRRCLACAEQGETTHGPGHDWGGGAAR